MNNYQNMIKTLADKIWDGLLIHLDTIIIGDNSIGKSDLLQELIERDKDGGIYFLDVVNRRFLIERVEFEKKKKDIEYNKKIIETRSDRRFFNQEDSFQIFGTATDGIESLYPYYAHKVRGMFKEFTNHDFLVKRDIDNYALIDGKERRLSNGYQALIRIFFELEYYQDMVVKYGKKKQYLFIIDEINECLTPNNAYRLLMFIKKYYKEMNFVVTTQCADVIVGTCDCNIIAILPDERYEILDTNDFDNIIDANNLFIKSFSNGNYKEWKQMTDRELARLFNNRISGELGKEDQETLRQIKEKKLTKAQTVLLRQIEEW